MSALPADVLAGLRAGLSAGLNAQTVQYQVLTAGVPATAVNLSALVTVQTRAQMVDPTGHKLEIADVIHVRPLADETLVLGDYILYGGQTYIIDRTEGTDVRRLTASYKPTIGFRRTDRFAAEGG
jgi:hypothetical protein